LISLRENHLFTKLLDFGLGPAFRSALSIRAGLNGKVTERLQIGNVEGINVLKRESA